eukprot:TRINITY_DN7822_c0_g1_i1.p1 TRINITY_DN7822_c0_g1~~TRINITY_DN7822_c0_g1_i1.p1  ORF type:complete len:163 (-),score=24.52 TRINITY_DN7822_c0_g1_i1:6-494(-)
MASGIPSIVTNFSGLTDFVTNENSFLVRVESMVNSTIGNGLWANASESDLRQKMREAVNNLENTRNKGRLAAIDAAQYSPQKVADRIMMRLEDIATRWDEILSRSPIPLPTATPYIRKTYSSATVPLPTLLPTTGHLPLNLTPPSPTDRLRKKLPIRIIGTF